MKKSNQPTDTILIKTFSSDEYTSCDFAVIKLSEEWKEKMKARFEMAKEILKDNDLSHLVYWGSVCDFFDDKENETPADAIIGDEEDWCFVELDENEYDSLQAPAMDLDFYHTVIDRYGNISFKVTGKHCSTEYSTTDIAFLEIL